jgi:hypothetical protein
MTDNPFIVGIEDLKATDYNPLFLARKSTMQDKDRILLTVLNQSQSTGIRVIDIRDQFIEQYREESLDPAAVRRWINGKFTTFVNRGVLIRKSTPGSKKHYFEKSPYFDKYYAEQSIPQQESADSTPKTTAAASADNTVLHDELESYRQTMLSQLGEIEEYRRIRDQYPELEVVATTQFKQVVDENYRMLGRIRAIEKLIETVAS